MFYYPRQALLPNINAGYQNMFVGSLHMLIILMSERYDVPTGKNSWVAEILT